MSDLVFCYYCRTHHPRSEMRLVERKGGKRWRCIKSLAVGQRSEAERDAFGKKVTALNSDSQRVRSSLSRSQADDNQA